MAQTQEMANNGESGGEKVLEVRDLKVVFHTYAGDVKALDGVNFAVRKGETLGLVGESGCGKSVTAAAIVGLLPENASVTSGEVLFNGEDMLRKSKEEKRAIRSSKIAMVFQDPMTFLNPVLTIGEQLYEVIELDKARLAAEALEYELEETRKKLAQSSGEKEKLEAKVEALEKLRGKPPVPRGRRKKAVLKRMATEILRKMRIPDAERVLKSYPHELSGGMRQRCMIAMALVRNPDLLIADEITTALDVTIQAQILELLRILRRELDSSIIIITHDLGVVAEICDRVAVMYAGNVVELADVKEVFSDPLHPYTKGLLHALPRISSTGKRLESIPGSVPDLIYPPGGCRFHPRCPYAWDICSRIKPELVAAKGGHRVACHLYSSEKND